MILNAKIVFLTVNAGLRWLNNVSGVYLIHVSFASYWSAGFKTFLQVSPCFPLAGGLCKFYANTGGKPPILRQPLLVQYKH
jgi:hypothetical protein